MKSHLGLSVAAALMLAPDIAAQPDVSATLDTSVSTMLIDRGEALATLNNDLALTIEASFANGTAYAGLYRISPFGDEGDAFDEEVDYTLGYIFETDAMAIDLSATYLSYPGNNDDASIELVSSATLTTALQPTLTGFYDADFEDYGLEFSLGPSWEVSNWSLYALGRVGFVQFGDNSGGYSYGGIEGGAERPLNETVTMGLFGRAEFSDDDTFADRFENDEITDFANQGVSLGLSLSMALNP